MRWLMILMAIGLGAAVAAAGEAPAPLFVSAFQCDATPGKGDALIWNVPLEKVLDPLLAKGIIIEQGPDRYVLCTVDWCLLCNDSELALRRKIAAAAKTDVSRVKIQAVHQHAAPYADQAAHKYLDEVKVLRLSDAFLEALGERLTKAVEEALDRKSEFDQVGLGEAKVDRVASARRLKGADGKIVTRFSTGGAKRELADAPEGEIDPMLKTITLGRGGKALVRMHFYATHPQTFACDGRASRDTVGIAREELQRSEGVFQLYFTGCSGDVTVGKYNDGKDPAREELAGRLLAGMKASIEATKWGPAGRIGLRSVDFVLPPRQEKKFEREALLALIRDEKTASVLRVYEGAMRLAYLDRIERPLTASCMELGGASIVQLPGEPMLEFQRFAQRTRPDRFVTVGGYFDCGPAYICTDAAIGEGGYEPSATNVAIGAESKLKEAIRAAMGSPARSAD